MFYVYVMANKKCGAIYIGQTADIFHRVRQHKDGRIAGYSKDHGCTKLVWFETHLSRDDAFTRERQLKKWNRSWKIELIKSVNPYWDDLSVSLTRDQFEEAKWQGQQVKASAAAYKAALAQFLRQN